jgi:hypothetical protein
VEGEDEIIISGAYKDFKKELRYGLASADDAEVAKVLGAVCDAIEPYAFAFSGINVPGIKAYAKPSGTGLKAVADFLKNNPQAGIKEKLKSFCPVPELMPAAESCFFNLLMSEAKVSFRMGDSIAKPSIAPSKEEAGDVIFFVGKYKSWISIKKLGLEGAKEYEVSAVLAGITHTATNKAFDLSGVQKDDALVSKATSGKRRAYGNLSDALNIILPELKNDRLADAYVICKTFEAIGFKPYASPEMLSSAHPDIKPPKVRGRKPKA